MDRGVHVLLDHALREQDRVLEVVALPRHEGDQHVAAERHLAVVDRGPVRQDVAHLDVLARLDQRAVVEARALVGARELLKRVMVVGTARVGLDHDVEHRGGVDGLQVLGVGDVHDRAGHVRDDHLARVLGGVVLDAGADQRRVGDQQRHRLALHVGAHQGAAGVVVLQERDHGRGHRDDLLRRHVHVLDVPDVLEAVVAASPGGHARVYKCAVRGEARVGLGDAEHVLLVSGQVLDLVGDPRDDVDRGHVGLGQLLDFLLVEDVADRQHLGALAVDRGPAQLATGELGSVTVADRHPVVDASERALHEPELVDLRVGGEVADEPDVRTLRGLDRADAAVVAVVDVAHVEPGPLAGKAAWPERRQPALVRQL